MEQPKVSIIIPIYETEKTIERCVRSLFEQTLDNIEYIFVDDCTPDRSIDILKELFTQYPERAKTSKIAKHNLNKGLPSARNTALSMATGTYIGMVDSDDWVEPTMFQILYESAATIDADIVWCDYYEEKDGSKNIVEQKCRDEFSKLGIMQSLFGIHPTLMGCVWNKLIKRHLYSDYEIRFPDGLNQGEDIATIVKLIYCANTFYHVPRVLYHYVINCNSLTSNKNRNALRVTEYLRNYIAMERFFRSVNIIDKIKTQFSQSALDCKIQFLLDRKARNYKMVEELMPESNDIIFSHDVYMRKDYRFLLYAATKHLSFPFLLKDLYSWMQSAFSFYK
jgi:glycosyltransferase involved in cell wall biosynthesis